MIDARLIVIKRRRLNKRFGQGFRERCLQKMHKIKRFNRSKVNSCDLKRLYIKAPRFDPENLKASAKIKDYTESIRF
jgi:hypothetical protein